MNTSNIAIVGRSSRWTNGSGCDCVASYGVARVNAGEAAGAIINAGRMLTLTRLGCLIWKRPRRATVNPCRGELPTGEPDAGEPPVRFGGGRSRNQSVLPTPISPPPFQGEKQESPN